MSVRGGLSVLALGVAGFVQACAATAPEPSILWPEGPLHDATAEWGGGPGSRGPHSPLVALPVTTVHVGCESSDIAPPRSAGAMPPTEIAPRQGAGAMPPSESCPEFAPLGTRELAQIARVQPLVRAAATARDVPTDLINAMIWVESRFDTRAVSNKGALGLMQLMPGTGREVARELGRRYRPYDPEFNIHAGTFYFAQMLRRFDWNLRLALAAYNAGPYAVEDWTHNRRTLPDESREYVSRVLVAARAFRALVTAPPRSAGTVPPLVK